MQMTRIASSAEELPAGRNSVGAKLSLNNWQQDAWRGLFFPCYCCCQRKSLRFPLISALHVSHLWVTAMTGKQEPWMVQIDLQPHDPGKDLDFEYNLKMVILYFPRILKSIPNPGIDITQMAIYLI